jgi:hypothetical protein
MPVALSDADKRRIEEEEQYRQRERARISNRQRSSKTIQGCVGCLFLLALGTIVPFACDTCSPGGPPSISPEAAQERERADAYFAACEFVRKQLKAPRTAKFPTDGLFSGHRAAEFVTSGRNHEYTVRAWVDAENSFGAMIRTEFVCRLRANGAGSWTLESLDM